MVTPRSGAYTVLREWCGLRTLVQDAHQATEAVQQLCIAAGVEATAVTVPWLDKKKKKLQKHRGHAFVQLDEATDTARCVEGLLGSEVRSD